MCACPSNDLACAAGNCAAPKTDLGLAMHVETAELSVLARQASPFPCDNNTITIELQSNVKMLPDCDWQITVKGIRGGVEKYGSNMNGPFIDLQPSNAETVLALGPLAGSTGLDENLTLSSHERFDATWYQSTSTSTNTNYNTEKQLRLALHVNHSVDAHVAHGFTFVLKNPVGARPACTLTATFSLSSTGFCSNSGNPSTCPTGTSDPDTTGSIAVSVDTRTQKEVTLPCVCVPAAARAT